MKAWEAGSSLAGGVRLSGEVGELVATAELEARVGKAEEPGVASGI